MTTFLNKFRIVVRFPDLAVKFLRDNALTILLIPFCAAVPVFRKREEPTLIRYYQCASDHTQVDSFWGIHTVIGWQLALVRTAFQSRRYLEWRFSLYPLFKEFMQLWGKHDGQVLLDYGCGPGNDLVGFLTYTNAGKVIGIDISQKALRFASKRLALHKVDPKRVELICISDSAMALPIDDNSVDYIYCEGVLHHTSNPEGILREFYRVLKPGAQACIMVYNRDSIWICLGIAYRMQIIEGEYNGLTAYQAFEKDADSGAPIARCYRSGEFISLCEDAGFKA